VFVDEFTAMAMGRVPTESVSATAFVAPLITVTLLLPALATKIVFVDELSAMASGCDPTGTVAVTAFEAPSITDTLLLLH